MRFDDFDFGKVWLAIPGKQELSVDLKSGTIRHNTQTFCKLVDGKVTFDKNFPEQYKDFCIHYLTN